MILFTLPRTAVVQSGNSYPGASLYFYLADTSTLATIYSDVAGTATTNPQTANAAGVFAPIWLDPTVAVDVEVRNSAGAVIQARTRVNDAETRGDTAITAAELAAGLSESSIDQTYSNGLDQGYVNAKRYKATGNGTTSDQAALQAAINAAYASNLNLFIPAGIYLVTGLTLPATTVAGGTPDDRAHPFTIFGAGYGEAFVVTPTTAGTTIKSVTNAPVLKDKKATSDGTTPAEASTGTLHLYNLRFDGTSSTHPVVKLESFYGQSTIKSCAFYQRSTGDGLAIYYGATWTVENCYSMNTEWNATTLGTGSSRTGAAFRYEPTSDMALATFKKCTGRGFKYGFYIGGGAGIAYSVAIRDCECSVNYTGIVFDGAQSCSAEGCYFEGGDGGSGVELINASHYTSIANSHMFYGSIEGIGYAIGIKDEDVGCKGTLIADNFIALGRTTPCIGISVNAEQYARTVIGNTVVRSQLEDLSYAANQIGIKVAGAAPRVTLIGNVVEPEATWTGTGSYGISDISTSGGAIGLTTVDMGGNAVPMLARGAVSLQKAVLTSANISAGVLVLPAGSYFTVSCGVSVSVSALYGADATGRLVALRTTNALTQFNDAGVNVLASTFTGPGVLTLLLDSSAGAYTAYELARSTH